jgi:hypothetical protein
LAIQRCTFAVAVAELEGVINVHVTLRGRGQYAPASGATDEFLLAAGSVRA